MSAAMDIDMELVIPVSYMMRDGIKIDLEKLVEHQDFLRQKTGELGFNPGSPLKLKSYFQDKGYKIDSTAKEVLKTLDDPIAERVLEYREVSKLSSSYSESIPDMLDVHNRVHPYIQICGTNTGRFAIRKPAMQTIPPDLRDIVTTSFGNEGQLISIDASQSELRCLAYLADSKHMIDAYADEIDFHTLASELAGIDRKHAKTLNFAFVYGSSEHGLVNVLIKEGIAKRTASSNVKK